MPRPANDLALYLPILTEHRVVPDELDAQRALGGALGQSLSRTGHAFFCKHSRKTYSKVLVALERGPWEFQRSDLVPRGEFVTNRFAARLVLALRQWLRADDLLAVLQSGRRPTTVSVLMCSPPAHQNEQLLVQAWRVPLQNERPDHNPTQADGLLSGVSEGGLLGWGPPAHARSSSNIHISVMRHLPPKPAKRPRRWRQPLRQYVSDQPIRPVTSPATGGWLTQAPGPGDARLERRCLPGTRRCLPGTRPCLERDIPAN